MRIMLCTSEFGVPQKQPRVLLSAALILSGLWTVSCARREAPSVPPQLSASAAAASPPAVVTSYEDQMGCVFTPPEKDPLGVVRAKFIDIPDFPGRWAIWGSTGRDNRGHLWFGVSAHDVQPP